MATDQNQSRMKPRIWLATGRTAKLGAERLSPGETGRTDRAGKASQVLCGVLAAVGSPRGGFHGARSPARPPAVSARALYT